MNVASSQNHLARAHHHHLSLREHLLEHLLRQRVLLHAEARRDDRSVREVEVHVRRGHALVLLALDRALLLLQAAELLLRALDVRGNQQLVDLQVTTLRVRRLRQQLEGMMADRVLRVLLVVRPREKNLAGTSEHAEIVHVTVRVDITVQTVRQPNHLLHTQTAL